MTQSESWEQAGFFEAEQPTARSSCIDPRIIPDPEPEAGG